MWYTDLDKVLLPIQKYCYFSYFSTKIYVVGTHQKCLGEALLIGTHNICFHMEIRKIFTWYPFLSRPTCIYLTYSINLIFPLPRLAKDTYSVSYFSCLYEFTLLWLVKCVHSSFSISVITLFIHHQLWTEKDIVTTVTYHALGKFIRQ